MSYYPQTHSHIKDKVKIILGMSNYAVKMKIHDALGVNTSNLDAKSDFL